MSAQFFHIDSFARMAGKGKEAGHTIWSIAAEADRRPDACKHVEDPGVPRVLVGTSMHDAAKQAKAWADDSRDAMGRGLRADGLCMAVGVISLPPTMAGQPWEDFRDDVLDWLHREFGDRLRCVLEHADEKTPHLHFGLVPLPGERFSAIHAGKLAAEESARRGEVKGKQNEAYKAAMQGLQDRFHAEVAVDHGLTRVGPMGRRLTRRAWLAEQEAAERQAELNEAAQLVDRRRAELVDLEERARVEAQAVNLKIQAAETQARSLAKQQKALVAEQAKVRNIWAEFRAMPGGQAYLDLQQEISQREALLREAEEAKHKAEKAQAAAAELAAGLEAERRASAALRVQLRAAQGGPAAPRSTPG